MINSRGMYSEVTKSKDEEDTLVDSAPSSKLTTMPLIPLTTLRRQAVKPPSLWTSLRIWIAVKLARLAADIAP